MPVASTSASPSHARAAQPAWPLAAAAAVGPLGLALLLWLVGRSMSASTVVGAALQALFLSAPPWLGLLALPWASGLAWRWRRPALVLPGLIGLPMVGAPAPAPGQAGPQDLRVVVANVNSYPDVDDRAALDAALAALGGEVVILIEERPRAVSGLVHLADNFDPKMPRISHGTAVFCLAELGCRAEITPEFGSATSTMPLALVAVGDLCVLGVHGPPPAPLDPTGLLPYFGTIADRIEAGRLREPWGPCAARAEVVLAGDFNTVPHSPALALLDAAGLRDLGPSRGLFALTWPAGGGWPKLPLFRLDHVFGAAADIADYRLVRLPGSDHKAQAFTVPGRRPTARSTH